MSWDINRVIVVGRVASEIELKHTQSGKSVANFRVAVGGMPKPDGSDSVSFFNVVVWGKSAENCQQYLAKGKQIGIDGRLDQRSWQAQDGSKRSTVEIVADRVEFLGPNTSGQGGNYRPKDESAPKAASGNYQESSAQFYDNTDADYDSFNSDPIDMTDDSNDPQF
ncbi:MAG: hypothetical protein A2Y33_04745 [Spirochaetes bacterium GWF1_51_8]|nr:MAG: hypothetical protein A2Y33_04745 [Spirochaetes bacterium GWF1_51_8]